ncbi:GNAT family N-acetyltransferase [Chamaesiphon minutus]|uniref:Acetyltransferase, ribosomal protein N-acetylase n=1 Tax=Chamaesiphon minutus (strain ATCC 27169 / PCC 6605) TaxID=1173020 RepID=K9UJM9_CHAP6|nr:GNAT family protein [Chamaesiphon minutus]AFY94666.1 acetyltransferase, ribosomal protein N-acetylase [Chamaesiphon minutus PCC 6605]
MEYITVEASLIRLRQPEDSDLALMVAMRNNLELQAMLMSLPRASNNQRVRDWLNHHLNNPQSIFFIIAEITTDLPCGYIQVTNIDFVHRHGELGICIDSSYQGKGYGKQAINAIEQYTQEIFNLRKLTLKVLEKNQVAIHLYETLTYQKIGIYQEHFYNQGTLHNVVAMEKLLR